MRQCEAYQHPEIRKLVYISRVGQRPIVCGDPYHWENLAVMHASKGMSGDTVNANHEQCHHHQLLMSMHSLYSDDTTFSQKMTDRVMADTTTTVLLRTWPERQQRWLVNQQYALYVISLLDILTIEGVMCLIV